ncbi:protein kinase [Streptomyces sioyaensis]|uniref:protein kinase domain-containing protein n=1 Tax=Streptomyces sioyaensis TaxID=67364 RepID=UPI0037D604BC
MEAGASADFGSGPYPGGVRRLGNRYELGALLGLGGTAEVHAAHDLRLDRSVAVKTLRSDLVGDPSSLARFRREALSAASLNHPSVVAVYDTGEDFVGRVHVPYIVMERVDGPTIADLLAGGHRLPPARALELTAGVLQALAYAHRSGVVHSDIKPANVMLSDDGAVKVTDFGTARHVDVQGAPLTQHTAVIGTPKYLSPEQARGEAVGAPADLYSTGCLLYELLTARPPFLGDGVLDLIIQHVESPAAAAVVPGAGAAARVRRTGPPGAEQGAPEPVSGRGGDAPGRRTGPGRSVPDSHDVHRHVSSADGTRRAAGRGPGPRPAVHAAHGSDAGLPRPGTARRGTGAPFRPAPAPIRPPAPPPSAAPETTIPRCAVRPRQ